MNYLRNILLTMVAVSGLFAMVPADSVSAALVNPKAEICRGANGTWDGKKCIGNTTATVQGSLKDIVNLLLFVIGAIAVIVIVVGAIRYTLSGGDSNQITSAKNTILYAVVGLVIAILAYSIVNFVVGAF